MLAHVYEGVRTCADLADVIVATDASEIADVCRANGWNVRLTSASHRSGTDRVHEVAQTVAADVYVNVQGDEPMARREHLDVLLGLMRRTDVQVGTLKTPCAEEDFSRATIPFNRDGSGTVAYFKHLGFYAYRKAALDAFCAWPESQLERSERLEQLRFLDNGVAIHVAETPFDTVGVDTEEDLKRVETSLAAR